MSGNNCGWVSKSSPSKVEIFKIYRRSPTSDVSAGTTMALQISLQIGATPGSEPSEEAKVESMWTHFAPIVTRGDWIDVWNIRSQNGIDMMNSAPGISEGDLSLVMNFSEIEEGKTTVLFQKDTNTGLHIIGVGSGVTLVATLESQLGSSIPFSIWEYTCTGGGASAGAAGSSATLSSAPASTSRTAPTAPTVRTFPPSGGGSILLLHSDADPPPLETSIIPQPSDFLTSGTPGATANPLTFSGVTNNSLNTIYYFLMDAAQNISFHGKISFYNDQTPPVVIPNFPTPVAPYTGIWLGPEKLHLDGSIEANDSPT